MKQFPLVLAYCFTVEKVQGMTITENCYIDLGTNNKGGLTYVALSRSKLFKNIILNDIKEIIFKK